jgi:L-ascorbate metabolism protein UlaG (beta-lactamase superfamily)
MHRLIRYLLALTGASLLLSTGCSGGGAEPIGIAPSLSLTGAESPQPAAAEFISDDGDVTVNQVRQMSVVIEAPEGVIYTDPTGGGDRYADQPAPDVIVVSHEHHEHYDAATLEDLLAPDTQLIVPPYVMDSLPDRLKENAVSLANGQESELGRITVEAVPAYGISTEAEQWHPRGRGNGYVVTVDDRRIYLAGSTQATPEMLELEDIYLAFLPLYAPYATGPADAVTAVSTFLPEVTYIYQYNSEEAREEFVRRMDGSSMDTTVIAPEIVH